MLRVANQGTKEKKTLQSIGKAASWLLGMTFPSSHQAHGSRRYEAMFSEKAARNMFLRQRAVLSETPREKQKWVFSSTAWVEAPARSAVVCVASAAVESVPGLVSATFWTGDHFPSLGLDFLILNTQQQMALTLRSLLFLCTNNSRSELILSARKFG